MGNKQYMNHKCAKGQMINMPTNGHQFLQKSLDMVIVFFFVCLVPLVI